MIGTMFGGPDIKNYEHVKAFNWGEFEGKSHSELNRAINGKKVVFGGLNDKIQTPMCVMAMMLAGILAFGMPLAVGASALQYGANIVLTNGCIVSGTLTGVSALVAAVAAIVLIHRHHNKLTQQEIQEFKQQFDIELREEVGRAERGV